MGVFNSHNTQIKQIFYIFISASDGDKCLICASTAGNVRVNYCTVFEQYCIAYKHTRMYVTNFELNIYLGKSFMHKR